MPIDFSIQQSTTPTSLTMSEGFVSDATGSLFGNAAVLVESPMSLLADAAEEMTFAADVTDEFELDERKERDDIAEAMTSRVKMYQELMHETGDPQKLDQLKDSIRARAGKEHVLREARRYFSDPSDAWAALKEAHDALSKDPAVKQSALNGIQEALDAMEAEEGPAIRAGIQGRLAAKGFETLGDGDTLRGLYRQTVYDFTDVNDLYSHIQSKYGNDFELAISFLYKAVANDLATDTPSMETRHLENVNANLGELRTLQSAHSLCSNLVSRWENVHDVKNSELDPMNLLGMVVGLRKENFLGAAHVNTIVDKTGAPDIEHRILFLQELLNTTRSFSPTLFDGNEGRMKVLNAVQDAVDSAIAVEDEYLANLE